MDGWMIPLLPLQVRPLNVDGSLNLLGLETVRLIYFRNKMAGKNSQVCHVKHHMAENYKNVDDAAVKSKMNSIVVQHVLCVYILLWHLAVVICRI